MTESSQSPMPSFPLDLIATQALSMVIPYEQALQLAQRQGFTPEEFVQCMDRISKLCTSKTPLQ